MLGPKSSDGGRSGIILTYLVAVAVGVAVAVAVGVLVGTVGVAYGVEVSSAGCAVWFVAPGVLKGSTV